MNNTQNHEAHVRAAVEADQDAITTIVRDAHIFPFGLKWDRFVLAVDNEQIVGTGQIKPHGDGSLELASIAVIPSRQSQGIGSLVVNALIAQHGQRTTNTDLYLMCRSVHESYYNRFGFQRIERLAMPRYFRRVTMVGAVVFAFRRLLRPDDKSHLIVMRRDSHQAP